MIKELIESLEKKRILILGFGVEGRSTYRFLRRYFPEKPLVISYQGNDFEEEKEYLTKDPNLTFMVGKQYLEHLDEFDTILKSPGVSFKGMDTSLFMDKITSQLELFLEYMDCYTIGVTGSKGKSTTSSLIYQMLEEQGKDSILLGNIGIPILDHIEEITKEKIVVLEMSSHGLEFVKKSPNIGIVLNIYEEHLDHYNSLQHYIKAKYNIFQYQNKKDIAIFNMDNELMKQYSFNYPNNCYAITMQEEEQSNTIEHVIWLKQNMVYDNQTPIYDSNQPRNLKGKHNLNDIMFVLAVSKILGLNHKKTLETIQNFRGLEHRMEYVGKYDGIYYYNDSIATIPEATINCIEALEKVDTIIVGGKDRGIDLTKLIQYLNNSKVNNILCLPKTGEYIYKGIDKDTKTAILVENLEEAIKYAKQNTKKEHICVLSPAASSYGYFKNFKERGNRFKELVQN